MPFSVAQTGPFDEVNMLASVTQTSPFDKVIMMSVSVAHRSDLCLSCGTEGKQIWVLYM